MNTISWKELGDRSAHILGNILETFTYKEGWEFFLECPNGKWVLRIVWQAPDTRHLRMTQVSRAPVLPLFSGWEQDEWENWLRLEIRECEIHESDEWMLFDGVRKYDPHK